MKSSTAQQAMSVIVTIFNNYIYDLKKAGVCSSFINNITNEFISAMNALTAEQTPEEKPEQA